LAQIQPAQVTTSCSEQRECTFSLVWVIFVCNHSNLEMVLFQSCL